MTHPIALPAPDNPPAVSYSEAIRQAGLNHLAAISRARDELNEAVRPHWRTYTDAIRPARRCYDQAVEAANQTYDAAIAAAVSVYNLAAAAPHGGHHDQ